MPLQERRLAGVVQEDMVKQEGLSAIVAILQDALHSPQLQLACLQLIAPLGTGMGRGLADAAAAVADAAAAMATTVDDDVKALRAKELAAMEAWQATVRDFRAVTYPQASQVVLATAGATLRSSPLKEGVAAGCLHWLAHMLLNPETSDMIRCADFSKKCKNYKYSEEKT